MVNTTIRDRASSEGSSDSEGGERPVRDKLKKTSIAGLSSKAQASTDKGPHPLHESISSEPAQVDAPDHAPTSSRGRPARKRSFDDLQNDEFTAASQAEVDEPEPAKNGHHKRMRSRDISSGEHVSLAGLSENGITTPLEGEEEESDMDAQKSPGGPGVLVDATIDDDFTKIPEDSTEPESMLSPKKKRSRDQSDKEDGSTLDPSDLLPPSGSQKESEPDKKRYREEEQAAFLGVDEPTLTSAPSNAFANASTASPFSSFASPKKSSLLPETKPAEPSAFKSSGLSAFASSENSPFGAIGSTSSGFGGTTSSGGFVSAATSSGFISATASSGFGAVSATSAFGNARATSPFGGTSIAGFGSLGGLPSTAGFGSSSGFGGGIAGGLRGDLGNPSAILGEGRSTFAGLPSSKAMFGLPSTTKQKAFGAPEADDDSRSGDESGSEKDEDGEPEETQVREARLKERTDRVYSRLCNPYHSTNTLLGETGEEDEEVVIKCRAKLYYFENREWKERGIGDLKINVRFELKEGSDEEAPQFERKARIIMRTEHVHRVVLNTPIFKGMKVGNQSGDEPNGKFLNLAGMENGKPALFMLKV
jgi:Ran-binding protein 3